MIMPAKMFSAMGVWTSLEPQLTTPAPAPPHKKELRAKKSQAADCGHRDLAARPELVRARRVRGEPSTRALQPNLASGLSRERVEGRLALPLRRLVSRHMGLRLVLVRFRFLFFLISFLSLRHGDPPVCSLDPPF
jgi:hypothetical protein